jgi:hypothetical protein
MINSNYGRVLVLCLIAWGHHSYGLTRYVNVNNPSPVSPYTSWATAATLTGFTLTQGATRNAAGAIEQEQCGGGVWCFSTNCWLSNCILSGNSASFFAGGARSGTLQNCVLYGNNCDFEGGGAYGGTCYNCTFNNNSADFGAGAESIIASNCVFNGNMGTMGGGADSSVCYNSVLAYNSATFGGGAMDGALINCLVVSNLSSFVGGGAEGTSMTNCTLVGNSSTDYGGGATGGTLYNCVLCYNTAPSGPNFDLGTTLNYCCTTPLPGSGLGNFTNPPLFVNAAAGNLRLQASSPCINAGYNGAVRSAVDLDGNPRASRAPSWMWARTSSRSRAR